MALTYRLYRSIRIGTGARDNPWRSKLTLYITADGTGADFWDWIHDARPVRYALTRCDSTVHTQIAADIEITPLSPELSTLAALNSWGNELASTIPLGMRDQLEADGCSMSWVTAQTTKREVLRYLSRMHRISQELRRLRESDALDFLMQDLTRPVAQVPLAARTRISTWMHNHDLETTWITGSTTVREVIHFILEQRVWDPLPFGALSL